MGDPTVWRTSTETAQCDATVGRRVRAFVVAHSCGQEVPGVQFAQPGELLALLAAETGLTVVVGDFNSDT